MIDHVSGYYKVGDRVFMSKMEACIHSTSVNQPVTFHFYDELWTAANDMYQHNPLVNLEEMYKQRALQIRANYGYLVLHFSGGADSTTILDTFLKNNIKLDEIFVLIPKKILGSELHKPNMHDTSATNMLSEWDFTIKPKLDYVRANYPDIKIVVHDWTDALNDVKITDDLLLKQNHNFGLPNFGFNESFSPSNLEYENKGVRVANIVGTDKPILVYNSQTDTYSTCFLDTTLVGASYQHGFNKIDVTSKVYFYYAIDYTELALARAYVAATFFKNNPEYNKLIDITIRKDKSRKELLDMGKVVDRLVNTLMYPNWNINTFQVDKPDNFNKIYHPWFNYIYQTNEFDEKHTLLRNKIQEFGRSISRKNKTVDIHGNMLGLNILTTKQYKLKI